MDIIVELHSVFIFPSQRKTVNVSHDVCKNYGFFLLTNNEPNIFTDSFKIGMLFVFTLLLLSETRLPRLQDTGVFLPAIT